MGGSGVKGSSRSLALDPKKIRIDEKLRRGLSSTPTSIICNTHLLHNGGGKLLKYAHVCEMIRKKSGLTSRGLFSSTHTFVTS